RHFGGASTRMPPALRLLALESLPLGKELTARPILAAAKVIAITNCCGLTGIFCIGQNAVPSPKLPATDARAACPDKDMSERSHLIHSGCAARPGGRAKGRN